MKYFKLSIVAIFLTCNVLAQNTANLIFFTEQGEQFFVILNGAQQNAAPETQVKITGLNAEFYRVKIRFSDTKIPDLDRNLPVELGNESAISIRKNNKGVYVFRPISVTPLAEAPAAPRGQRVLPYNPGGVSTTTELPGATTSTTISTGTNNTKVTKDVQVGGSMTTTVNVEESNPNGNGERVGMDVNIGGVNMNVDVQVDEPVTTTTTTRTTTRTTTQQPATRTTTTTKATPAPTPAPAPAQRCNPMSEANFTSALNSIKSKGFDDTRLTVARQINSANCLTSMQVKRICETFSFEATSLTFAKEAYAKVFDPGNYFKVNDIFKFESSISELNKHIQGAKQADEDEW